MIYQQIHVMSLGLMCNSYTDRREDFNGSYIIVKFQHCVIKHGIDNFSELHVHMSLITRKPVFGVCNQGTIILSRQQTMRPWKGGPQYPISL